jgi:hypothetical protein
MGSRVAVLVTDTFAYTAMANNYSKYFVAFIEE